jgi:hypothetical protein
MIAAGGGGDAITAAVLGPFIGLADEPVILTYAWDRLIIDPLPGPRSAADFTDLRQLAPDVLEILPTTEPIAPAGSTLPQLAAELRARLLLLDPTGGAVGMARQIAAAAEYLDAEALALVDVGGDALTIGHEEGLRSPLADLLALAACSLVDLPARLLVPGPGIDGELPEAVVLDRIAKFGGQRIGTLDAASVKPVREVFAWHPSEASGLLAVAAEGIRGLVEVRDAGCHIHLADETPAVFVLDAHEVTADGPGAALLATTSLADAQAISTQLTGISEIDYERRKAERARSQVSHSPGQDEVARVDVLAAEASARGAGYVTVRRLSELSGVRSWPHLIEFRRLLSAERFAHYRPPVYQV